MTVTPMGTLLAQIKEVFTWLVSLVADIIALIVAQPILLLPIGVSIAFVGLKFFKKVRKG